MKAEDIRNCTWIKGDAWFQEIAYQLAVMNERREFDGGDLPTKPGKNSHTYHYSADSK